MNCDYCAQEIKQDFTSYNDCVLEALKKAKNHYLFVKNLITKRDEQLKQLQLRNEKLVSAVALLQKEKKKALASPRKRRKAPATIDLSCHDDEQEAAAMDKTADDLNMALNSEAIFDCSSADVTAVQWTPPHNEIIGETELVRSPRVLHKSIELRRKLHEHNNNEENQKPNAATGGDVVKMNTTSSWIAKGKKPQTDLRKSTTLGASILVDRNESFIKPLAVPRVENRLSLKKRVKLKQTRLQLDVAREKSSSGSDATFCEEAIGDSPFAHKETKPARSWLLRTDNSSVNSSRKEDEQNKQTDIADIKFDSEEDEYFENAFQLAQNITTTSNEKSAPELLDFTLSASSPEKADVAANKPQEKNESSQESVIMLTPATEDIIILDDTCINTHIESMDLAQDLLKCDEKSLEHLKRIEMEKIKKLQQIASKVSVALDVTPAKPKQEKATQQPTTSKAMPNVADLSSDESQDLMPQPFIVKQEAQNQKINIKEKYNIDCRDCQKYINFFGPGMTEKEIKTHLERCTIHQGFQQTPEDFWNPFIASLDANDPRNETLIDERFCDKNK